MSTVSGTKTKSAKNGQIVAYGAIINSMLPTRQDDEPAANDDSEYYYDEFGFRIEKDDPTSINKEADSELDKSANNGENSGEFISIRLNTSSPNTKRPRGGIKDSPLAFVEDSKHKLKWVAYLEFTLNADMGKDFSWEQVTSLNRCEKLRAMIRGQGVPHSLRPFIWMRLCGSLKKKQTAKFKYVDLFKNFTHDQYHTSKQIEKDLLRTLPTNACFCSMNSVGIPRLRRILQSVAWLYPSIGYCQGMGTIAASLLLFIEEEDVFWTMCSIIEDMLPAAYYSHTLLGVQADMKVLRQLIGTYLPEIDEQLRKHDIEISLVCINWFLTLFSNVFDMRILLRVWDLFFYEGSSVLFQITLAMFKMCEKDLLAADSSSAIFSILSDVPSEIYDVDVLLETSIRVASSVNKSILDSARRKHQAYLMAQEGTIINTSNYQQNLPMSKERPRLDSNDQDDQSETSAGAKAKQLIGMMVRRSLSGRSNKSGEFRRMSASRTSSSISTSNEPIDENNNMGYTYDYDQKADLSDVKTKNILQTELLVNLRRVILKIAHHFQTIDPSQYKPETLNLHADYSIESHANDYARYMDTTKQRSSKRAKALLDFDKTDDDELGFKRNDIITVLSTKDDHCWIGELNGQKGWFPSKFVKMIDERNGKVYSPAGDDSVNESVRDLIRNEFMLAFRSILEHGLKKWSVLGGSSGSSSGPSSGSNMHPWSFIEEAAKKIVEKDFESVYSRLVLCKTYRLDEDGKVLTPDELLFRSVQLVNLNHDAQNKLPTKAILNSKLASLICIGLNEQCLHIWLETLCSSLETVEKWYQPWSFIRSPGWVQIKCELRILAQFSFFLSAGDDGQLVDGMGLRENEINECIRDMLVKYHLFSWEI